MLNIQKKVFNMHCDLPFLAERKEIEKFNKFVFCIHDTKNCVVHIKALKQALSH